jgi:hypothetical protein
MPHTCNNEAEINNPARRQDFLIAYLLFGVGV